MDERKAVHGQLAIPTGKALRLNFCLPECFSKELEYWWKGFAISNFLNFNMTCSILANLCLKGGSIGFFRVNTLPKFKHKLPVTKIWKKYPPQLYHTCHSNEMTPLLFYLRPYFSAVETVFPKSFTGSFPSNSRLDVPAV